MFQHLSPTVYDLLVAYGQEPPSQMEDRDISALVLFNSGTQEILLTKRSAQSDDFREHWSYPGGWRNVIEGEDYERYEHPLVAAVTEGRDELGSLPRGRLRLVPHEGEATGVRCRSYVLEIDTAIADRFQPSRDAQDAWEWSDWGWFAIERLRASMGLGNSAEPYDTHSWHPGLVDLIRNYHF